jgi:hypothetical protein
MGVIVTLETFSGRPNPEWSLAPPQIVEFERRLDGLRPVSGGGAADQDEPLGYRGFTVRDGDAPVSVFRGRVTKGRKALADPGRQFERWLLHTGVDSLAPGLTDYVNSEIASGH